MAEYIEKEALEKRIHTGMNIIEVMQTIMDTPAVDAVEVVRCRESGYTTSTVMPIVQSAAMSMIHRNM